jgi:hypothetical protein
MNRHAVTEPLNTDNRLVVSVTSACFAYRDGREDGSLGLVIDYGGAELELAAADMELAEVFALGLARAALDFASQCRYLMGARP